MIISASRKEFGDIAQENSLKLVSCCEAIDLASYGIEHGKCVDDQWISRIIGSEFTVPRTAISANTVVALRVLI